MKRSINNIPEGYKRNSTLGVIPNEWEVKRLGEIFEIIAGGDIELAHVKNNKDEVFKYPIYANAAKNKGLYGFSDIYKIDYDCITVSGRGDIGIANARSGKFYPIVRLLVLNPQQKIDTIYFENAINIMRIYCENTGVPQLTSPQLSKYKVLVPPLPEQRKIAEVLSTWDKAIEKQTLLVEKLELRKKGLMQQLLTGKKRLHGFNGEWKKEKLGKLFDERNETKMPSLPLLSITADKGVISQTESEKKDTSNEDKSKYKRICPGDIGYNTMRMWQGRCALSKLEGIVSPAYTIVSPHNDVNPFYMEMLFKQPFMVYRFWTHSQGLVNDTLNCKYPAFSQVKVTIPKIEEQNAIAEILSFCDKEIALAKQKLDTLRQQKKGLMQVLLTGKKRI